MAPAQCPKVKGVDDLMMGELLNEAWVNGSCNYNGPYVAKAANPIQMVCVPNTINCIASYTDIQANIAQLGEFM